MATTPRLARAQPSVGPAARTPVRASVTSTPPASSATMPRPRTSWPTLRVRCACPSRPDGSGTRCRADHTSAAKSRSEEHTSELQSRGHLVCRLLLDKKKTSQLDVWPKRLQHHLHSRHEIG